MDGRKNNGGRREGAGRKPRSDEQKLIERLTPLEDEAHKALRAALKSGESWAVKLFFDYMYGKPKETVQATHIFERASLPPWFNEA